MTPYLTYSHPDDPESKVRFRQLACDPIPVWAVDVRDEPKETEKDTE